MTPAVQPGEAFGPVLVGMRGCGKSTLAPLVAELIDMSPVDVDAEIVKRTGMEIVEIFRRRGEAYFRRVEREMTLGFLQRPGLVVAAGGGSVLDADVRTAMRGLPTVWLQAPVATLESRVVGTPRPSLTGRPAHQELAQVLGERAAFYEEVAQVRVDTNQCTPKEAAGTIMRFWHGWRGAAGRGGG